MMIDTIKAAESPVFISYLTELLEYFLFEINSRQVFHLIFFIFNTKFDMCQNTVYQTTKTKSQNLFELSQYFIEFLSCDLY